MSCVGDHASVNGVIVASHQAVLSVQDQAVQYGFGVYESVHVLQRSVIYAQDHITRLMNSAAGIGLFHSFSHEQILTFCDELITYDAIEEATVRILLMGGKHPTLYITAAPPLTYPQHYYDEGVRVISYYGERLFPQYKTCSLLMNYVALQEAQKQQAFEALLIDRHQKVLEGTRSNFYACKGKKIYTAPSDTVLQGVTRDKILDAIDFLGYEIVFEAPDHHQILSSYFSELFISSTSMGALPISHYDKQYVSPPFPISQAIHQLIRRWERESLH